MSHKTDSSLLGLTKSQVDEIRRQVEGLVKLEAPIAHKLAGLDRRLGVATAQVLDQDIELRMAQVLGQDDIADKIWDQLRRAQEQRLIIEEMKRQFVAQSKNGADSDALPQIPEAG